MYKIIDRKKYKRSAIAPNKIKALKHEKQLLKQGHNVRLLKLDGKWNIFYR